MTDIKTQYEKVQIAKYLKANPRISRVSLIHKLLTNEMERVDFAYKLSKGVRDEAANMLGISVRTVDRIKERHQPKDQL